MSERPTIDIPRRESDTDKSYAALCDYCRMGPGRSLRKLHQAYSETSADSGKPDPPTTSERWIFEWSRVHDWQDRARAYDRKVEERKRRLVARELEEGLALPGNRVAELKKLFERLATELEENGALWLEDVKQVGSSTEDTFELIEIVRYNSAIINNLRGLLDDLAQETGGRIKKQDITTKGEKIGTQTIVIGDKEIEF